MTEYSPNKPESGPPSENASRQLGWSAMLAKWTEFAQAAVALPPEADGPRWRASVPPIITLQALVASLNELGQFPREHRPVAIDAAEALLREQLALIHEAWTGELIPGSIADLIEECRRAVFDVRHTGVEWRVIAPKIVAPNLEPIALALLEHGFRGDMHAARVGTTLFRGAPLAFFRPEMAINPPEGCESVEVVGPRQCYRQNDERTGVPVRDVVAAPEAPLQPGAPLLIPMILDGAPAPVIPGAAAPAPAEDLPVVEFGSDEG